MVGMRSITKTLRKLAGPVQTFPTDARVTLRFARSDDAEALARLAALDSSHAPRGTVLVADAGGELWAAVGVEDGHVVADPFRPSGELAFRLVERARRLGQPRRQRWSTQAKPTPLFTSRSSV
jgi:hypothetical protein